MADEDADQDPTQEIPDDSTRLTELEGDNESFATQLQTNTELIERIGKLVAEHDGKLGAHEKQLGVLNSFVLEATTGGPWHWERLTDEEAEKLWRQLVAFVQWLHHRYLRYQPAYALPACWYEHPLVVSHLTALMVAHQFSYNEAAGNASMQLVDFHERALWPMLNRIKDSGIVSKCAAGHQTPIAPTPPEVTDTLRGLMGEEPLAESSSTTDDDPDTETDSEKDKDHDSSL